MKKVLIVDDCEVNVILAQRFLTKMGWEVFDVRSGPECLEFLKTNMVDLILLDISMPEMSGFEVWDIANTSNICYRLCDRNWQREYKRCWWQWTCENNNQLSQLRNIMNSYELDSNGGPTTLQYVIPTHHFQIFKSKVVQKSSKNIKNVF